MGRSASGRGAVGGVSRPAGARGGGWCPERPATASNSVRRRASTQQQQQQCMQPHLAELLLGSGRHGVGLGSGGGGRGGKRAGGGQARLGRGASERSGDERRERAPREGADDAGCTEEERGGWSSCLDTLHRATRRVQGAGSRQAAGGGGGGAAANLQPCCYAPGLTATPRRASVPAGRARRRVSVGGPRAQR